VRLSGPFHRGSRHFQLCYYFVKVIVKISQCRIYLLRSKIRVLPKKFLCGPPVMIVLSGQMFRLVPRLTHRLRCEDIELRSS
jgi:hypothetical protein